MASTAARERRTIFGLPVDPLVVVMVTRLAVVGMLVAGVLHLPRWVKGVLYVGTGWVALAAIPRWAA